MRAVPKFKDAVMAIVDKFGIDLDRPGAYLRLEQEAYGNLVIENIGGSRISVTNYIQVGDDWIVDPGIVVFTERVPSGLEGPTEAWEWYPIETNQFFGGWQLSAEPDLRGDLLVYDVEQQAEMASLVETTVASMLIVQDWLDAGTLATGAIRARTLDEIHARDIRMDEMEDVPF